MLNPDLTYLVGVLAVMLAGAKVLAVAVGLQALFAMAPGKTESADPVREALGSPS
jgi:hypothetical protein